LKNHPEITYLYVDRKLEEGWEELKGALTPPKNFILQEIPFDGYKLLVFINVKEVLQVLDKHYAIFQRILERDFKPRELLEGLREGKGIDSWKKLLLSHVTKGILLGYGVKNAHLFERKIRSKESLDGRVSEDNDPRQPSACVLGKKPFRLPIFILLDEKEGKEKLNTYRKEREKIKKRYEGNDFLDVTLKQLYHR